MKLSRHSRSKGEGLAIWIILLALVAGAVWVLYLSRREAESRAQAFASEVAQSLAVNHDVKYLNAHLTPEAQLNYIPSWRDRLVQRLRDFCPVSQAPGTKGDDHILSFFFSRGRA